MRDRGDGTESVRPERTRVTSAVKRPYSRQPEARDALSVSAGAQGGAPAEPSQEVVDACRRGDRDALEQVLTRYTPDLERLIVRLIGPRADVDDVLQETLMAVVAAFPRYRGEARLRTWMTRIAVRVACDALRTPKTRRVVLALVPGENEPSPDHAHHASTHASPQPSIDRQVHRKWQLGRVYDHLAEIPAKRRLALVLHAFEGFPVDEVAALMGTTRAATKSRVFWARRALVKKARRDPLLRDLVVDEEDSR